MQERNAQIINHQQQHFRKSGWKFLPDPDKLQVWVFSVNTQTFSAFVLHASVLGHNTVTLFTFLSFSLMITFFWQPHHRESLPYPCCSSAQSNGWWEQNDHRASVHQEEIDSKAGGRYPPKRDISTAVPDSRNMQRMRWARGALQSRTVCHHGRWHFSTSVQDFSCCKCLGASKNTAKIQSVYRVKSTKLYQSYKGKANVWHVKSIHTISRLAHCTGVGVYMHSLAQTV